MVVYNKALFEYKGKMFDCLNNSDMLIESSDIEPIFMNKDFYDSVPDYLDYYQFSTIIDFARKETLDSISDGLLGNMQKIEMMLFQLILERTLTEEDHSVMCNYYELQNVVKDGHISGQEFEAKICAMPAKAINAVLIMENVVFLHNVILDEIYHAEYRMIDSMNNQMEAIKFHKDSLFLSKEIRSFTKYSENVAFCIQDAIKSIYKALDVTSKWLSYMKTYRSMKNRIPQTYFSNCKKEIFPNLSNERGKTELESICVELEPLTLIRNEITHNLSFNRNRQHLFVGYGTKGVCERKLLYSEMLFWDYHNTGIDRSYGRTGFFATNTNALSETKKFLILAIRFVNASLKYYFELLLDELRSHNIVDLAVWEGRPDRLVKKRLDDIVFSFYNLGD